MTEMYLGNPPVLGGQKPEQSVMLEKHHKSLTAGMESQEWQKVLEISTLTWTRTQDGWPADSLPPAC